MSAADKISRCPACNGRGYHLCDCWPGDCICGFGDETCDECMGSGRDESEFDEDFMGDDWDD